MNEHDPAARKHMLQQLENHYSRIAELPVEIALRGPGSFTLSFTSVDPQVVMRLVDNVRKSAATIKVATNSMLQETYIYFDV